MNEPLTPKMIEQITQASKKGSEKGIEAALVRFGINVENPLEVQRDLAFLTKQRKASEQVTTLVKRTLIATIVTGALGVILIGLKQVFH